VSGATSGTHRMQVFFFGFGVRDILIDIQANYDSEIRVSKIIGDVGSITYPSGGMNDFWEILERGKLKFGPDSNQRILIKYTNNTDAAQTDTRYIYYRAEEEALI
jgi:hypothetical protein